jgi:hypothetical protein
MMTGLEVLAIVFGGLVGIMGIAVSIHLRNYSRKLNRKRELQEKRQKNMDEI